MEYKVSVVIPLHNTDMGLFTNCVKSLKAQTIGFENVEWVIVLHNCNRETKTSVRQLLDGEQSVVLHELENEIHSPSSPRNYGIEYATGDYLSFLDADDMLTPECLQLALSYITRSGADLCRFRKMVRLEKEDAVYINETVLWDQTQEMIVTDRKDWDQKKLFAGIWGMSTANLFRRALLIENDLRFDESIRFAEDYHFMLGVYGVADRICLAPQLIGYIYIVNSGSLVQTTRITEELLMDYVEGYRKVFERGIENDLWMNDTMGGLMLIVLNWMQACPDLSQEGKKKLKTLLGPYIRRLTPIMPSKLYPRGRSDRINTFLTKYILREEPRIETFIERSDEGKGTTFVERQKDALKRILRNGMNSDYSRRYGFGDILTFEEYERRLPVSDYHTYLPMIRLTTMMGERGIFTDNEIISYAFVDDGSLQFDAASDNEIISYALVHDGSMEQRQIPLTYKALVPYIVAMRKSMGCGKTFLMSEAQPFEIDRLSPDNKYKNTLFGVLLREYKKEAENIGSGYAVFTTPKEYLFPEKPQDDISILRLFYALRERDVETVFAPDPDALCDCLKELENSRQIIIEKIEDTDRDRAEELKGIFVSQEKPSLKQIWPGLKKIVCWNVINEEVLDEVRPWLKDTVFSKGYYADACALYGEADGENDTISLIPDDVFYEFLPVSGGDEKQVCTAVNISEGEEYRVLVSNLCGLYRYDTGIQIKCVKKDEWQLSVRIV